MIQSVLNVGGGAGRQLPSIYKGWEQVLLDIDSNVKPDVVLDAKELRSLRGGQYDAVYCSHNLEHFYKHEVPVVLAGFLHVLKKTGFAHIAVHDMQCLFETVVRNDKDINDVWYVSGGGPISFHDVIYGWGAQVSQGNLYYAHKTGFTEKSLAKALVKAGFAKTLTARDGQGNLIAYSFKSKPSPALVRRLGA